MKKKNFEIIEGRKYPTIKAAAIAYGLKESRIYKRYQRGKRGDDLIPVKFRKSYSPPTTTDTNNFIVGNLKFKNPADACRQRKIDYNTYRSRIRIGWSIEEALELIPRSDKRSLKTQSSNINPQKRKRRNPNEPLIVFGKVYKTYKEISEAFGIKEFVLWQRVNRYGKTLEEAILMDGKNKKMKVGSVEFESMASCARAIGIEPNTFYYLKKHYTIKQIIGIENRMTSRSIVYRGKFYPNQVALAEDYGITKNEFYYRTYVCKLSLEDALSIPSNSSVVKSIFGNEAKLYIVEIVGHSENIIDETKLYKVGVTQHSLSKRYSELPFECKTVFSKDGDLFYLKTLEKMIRNKFQEKRFNDFTASDFDGFTEMYQLSQSELNNLKLLVKFDLLDSEPSKNVIAFSCN